MPWDTIRRDGAEAIIGRRQGSPPAGAGDTLRRPTSGLLRRRWRSIMGRHAPKTLSPALMARILTWREQVVDVGDISPRSRAILAAAISGTGQRTETGGEPEAGLIAKGSPRFEPIRSGTVLVREHAGVLTASRWRATALSGTDGCLGASPQSPAPSPASTGAGAASSVSTEACGNRVSGAAKASLTRYPKPRGRHDLPSALRDLHPRLQRRGSRAGLQFPRRAARISRGLHQEPGS